MQETDNSLFTGCRACECQVTLANCFEAISGGAIERFWARQEVGACSANSLSIGHDDWLELPYPTNPSPATVLYDPPITIPSIEQHPFPYTGSFMLPNVEIEFHQLQYEDGSPYAQYSYELLPSLVLGHGKPADIQSLVLRALEEGTARRGG